MRSTRAGNKSSLQQYLKLKHILHAIKLLFVSKAQQGDVSRERSVGVSREADVTGTDVSFTWH
jgi:hypothetical protein